MFKVGLIFIATAIVTALVGFVATGIVQGVSNAGEVRVLPRVAHAGGEIGGIAHTNSREAILESLTKGFQWIEIDFTWTLDGSLVCLQDWESNYEFLFKQGSGTRLSLDSFKEERSRSDFSLLSLEELGELMESHPQLTIITDIKESNLVALGLIAQKLPDVSFRVIPQIYSPDEYGPVRALGYQQVIWTLYRYPKQRDIDRVLREAKGKELVAISLSRKRVAEGHAKRLNERGIATFAHTINDPAEWRDLRDNWGVTQVYTDFLPAAD